MDKINNQQVSRADIVPDNEIICRVLQGEKNLYADIVRRYNQRLYRVGMSIINDDAETEDAMQVTYIHAWENLAKFKFKSSFSTWLTRIMINECLLRVRTRKKTWEMKDEITDYHDHIPGQQTAASKLFNDELRKILEGAILKLPEKYRTVFVLREVEKMSISETKECLSISEVNVKVRLNRAKAMLRTSLSDLYKTEPVFDFHLSRCDRMVNKVMAQIS